MEFCITPKHGLQDNSMLDADDEGMFNSLKVMPLWGLGMLVYYCSHSPFFVIMFVSQCRDLHAVKLHSMEASQWRIVLTF